MIYYIHLYANNCRHSYVVRCIVIVLLFNITGFLPSAPPRCWGDDFGLRWRTWMTRWNVHPSVAVCGPHLPHHLYQGLEDWFPRTNLAYFQGLIPWKPEDAASFAPKVFLPATGGHSAWLQIRMARSACECWSQKKATIESTWAASKCEESLVGICWNPGNHPGNYRGNHQVFMSRCVLHIWALIDMFLLRLVTGAKLYL